MQKTFINLGQRRVFAAIAALLFISFSAVSQTPPPKLTAAQWQADVRFLGDELPKRHKNAYHRMKREDFEAAVNRLYAAVPKMTDDEIIVGLMKLVTMVHDGHTNMIPRPFFQSGDGLYCPGRCRRKRNGSAW